MHLPAALAEIPFTAENALLAGVTRHQLRTLVASRRVTRVLRNVYVETSLLSSLEVRAAAAALVMPPFGVFCDRTAAWLHGVDVLEYHELDLAPRLDVVVLRHFNRLRRGEVTPRVRDLIPTDVMQTGKVRLTTPLRTALDLGCQLRRRSALATLDQFGRHHDITATDLEAELPRYRGRRGVIQLRNLVPLVDPRSESPGESWVRMAMIDAGLPPPIVQYPLAIGGKVVYRLDLAYPKHKICVEYDGEEFHTTSQQVAADRHRRAWLRHNGWIVIVVTKSDFAIGATDRWLIEVSEAVRLRSTPKHVRRFARPTSPRQAANRANYDASWQLPSRM
jgi:hypothetical protein